MTDCESNPFDPWCFCFNAKNESLPQYKQYNANNSSTSRGIGFQCCNIIHYDPSFIAQNVVGQGIINTNIEYLQIINNNVTNDVCDYSVYLNQINNDVEFQEKFPDLYNSANSNRILFNAFYTSANSVHQSYSLANNTDLLPAFSDHTVSCPNTEYVPYYVGYTDSEFARTRYIYICYPKKAAFPSIGLEYKANFFFDNNDNDCKKSTCTTTYEKSNIGLNVGTVSHKSNSGLSTGEIVAIVIGSVLFLAVIGFLIYYFSKKKS